MRQNLFLLIYFFFAFQMVEAQQVANQPLDILYFNKGLEFLSSNQDSARHYFELAQPIAKQKENWPYYIDCFNGIAACYYYQNDFENFQKITIQTITEAKRYLGEQHQVYADVLNNYGVFLDEKGDYAKALECYRQSVNIHSKNQDNLLEIATTYQNMATNYRNLGDYDEGINFLRKSLQIQLDSLGYQSLPVAKSYLTLGNNYRDKEEFQEALKYYHQCIDIYEALGPKKTRNKNDQIYAYQSLAKIHLAYEQFDSTDYYLQKAKALQTSANASRIVQSYEIQGDWYVKQGKFAAGRVAFEKANEHADRQYKIYTRHRTKGRTLFNLANHEKDYGDLDSSLLYYQKALQALAIDFETTDLLSNPSVHKLLSKTEALNIIEGKANAFSKRFDQTKDQVDLMNAFKNYEFATTLIHEMRKTFNADGSKNELAEKSLSIYEAGIKTALDLYQKNQDKAYLEKAFYFAEQNKARLLEESLQDNYAKLAGGLPTVELEREQNLSREISFYEGKINREKAKAAAIAETKVATWESKLFDLKNEYNELIASFEKEYPEYFALKHATNNTAARDIQTRLINGQNALLEYFVGTDHIFLFSLTENDLQVFEFPKPDNFSASFEEIRSIINQSPFAAINDFEQNYQRFASSSFAIYLAYLKQAIDALPATIEKLIIVPDDILAYLPFELLLLQPTENSDNYSLNSNAYLFEKYAITYNYSAGLLAHHSQQERTKGLEPFLGFAPTFGDKMAGTSRNCTENEIYTLQCNQKEVASIETLLGGRTITGETATLSSFTNKAQQCRILHLATHACIDQVNPDLNKIYFADDYLTGNDLNDLRLNAELAVLSACNTGSGKLVKGEGVMSLSRGFILSGCPSTLMSLWSVDDCTTSNIMLGFYKNLKTGLPKDVSLQKAKLEHLSKADKVNSHPYYWAAFVLSGNAESMGFSNNSSYLSIGLFLLVLLLISLYFFKKRKS